jgi:hypothetical protein
MKKSLITIIVFATSTILLSSSAIAVDLRSATAAGKVIREPFREKVASRAAGLVPPKVELAKLSGSITNKGEDTLAVSGVVVNISSTTILLRRFGAKSTLTEFSVGDEVQVIGKWADTNKKVLNAKIVRNLSIQKRRGVFLGTVSSTSTTGFVLTTLSRGTQTVTVSSTTKFMDRKEKPLTLSSIVPGHKVMVKGLWDNKLNTVTEVTFVRDYSLPVISPGDLGATTSAGYSR